MRAPAAPSWRSSPTARRSACIRPSSTAGRTRRKGRGTTGWCGTRPPASSARRARASWGRSTRSASIGWSRPSRRVAGRGAARDRAPGPDPGPGADPRPCPGRRSALPRPDRHGGASADFPAAGAPRASGWAGRTRRIAAASRCGAAASRTPQAARPAAPGQLTGPPQIPGTRRELRARRTCHIRAGSRGGSDPRPRPDAGRKHAGPRQHAGPPGAEGERERGTAERHPGIARVPHHRVGPGVDQVVAAIVLDADLRREELVVRHRLEHDGEAGEEEPAARRGAAARHRRRPVVDVRVEDPTTIAAAPASRMPSRSRSSRPAGAAGNRSPRQTGADHHIA